MGYSAGRYRLCGRKADFRHKRNRFDPDHARFSIHTPYCGYFSGAPEEEISLSDKICVEAENERITLALIAKDEIKMDGASEYILTAMGTTGMDETTFGKGPELMGIPFAAVEFKGKLYAETLEGCIRVKAENAKLEVLNPIGEVIAEMNGEKQEMKYGLQWTVLFRASSTDLWSVNKHSSQGSALRLQNNKTGD